MEEKWLLESIRWYVSGSRATPVLPAQIDWERLLALASRHQVSAVARHFLAANHPGLAPAHVLEKLKAQHHASAFMGQAKAARLAQLMAVFHENGLQAIPWRGITLAQAYYADPADRSFGDQDFLIQKESLPHIKTLLFSMGYRLVDVGGTAETMERDHHAMAFVKDELGVRQELDFHWAFSEKKWRVPFPDAELWHRLVAPCPPGRPHPSMHPEDLLLALTIHHGLRSRWGKLKYLLDFALVLKKEQSLDWQRLLAKAGRLGIERFLLSGILAAWEMTGVAVPRQVLDRARGSFRARGMNDAAVSAFSGGRASQLPRLLSLPKLPYRVVHALHERLFCSSENDSAGRFPAGLQFLIYPLRFFRLLLKYKLGLGLLPYLVKKL